METFKKYLLIVIQEKSYVQEVVFNTDVTGLFYKDAGKQMYTIHMTSWLVKTLQKDHRNLTQYFL
jgi:hypothetical protein